MNPVKVFIVDDHQVVRFGLVQFLNEKEDLAICGEAGDANTAIAQINSCSPDIIIVDLGLEGTSGIDLIKAIRDRYSGMHIMALTMHGENEYVRRAMNAGAHGYVLKSEPVDQVVDAIHAILEGKTYISPCLKDQLLDTLIQQRDDNNTLLELLTDREFEIFQLIGEGLDRAEISRKLNISASTIGTYRDRIKTKLNLKNSSELVKYAVQWAMEEKK